MSLLIRLATAADLDEVIELLAEASAWLRSVGYDQWPERFPPEYFAPFLDGAELHVAEAEPVAEEGLAAEEGAPHPRAGEVAATFILQWSDEQFWGDRSDAGFLHKLAVRRSHAGIGPQLIEWADRRAAEAGRDYLCLDCMAANPRIRRYYEELGFQAAGELSIPIEGSGSRSLQVARYERPVRASLAHPGEPDDRSPPDQTGGAAEAEAEAEGAIAFW